jgi:hypothetical protein
MAVASTVRRLRRSRPWRAMLVVFLAAACQTCHNENNRDAGPGAVLTLTVAGRPLGAGDSFDFGHVSPLMQEVETFTLTNDGEPSLVISGIEIAGDQDVDFEIVALPASATLAPGLSTTLVLRFRPRDAVIPMDPQKWRRTAGVTFTSNDPSGPLTITLSGTVGFADCDTGDDTLDHRRCNQCLLEVTPPVERYVDTYVRPFVTGPPDKIAALTTIRDRMFMDSPLFLFGNPPTSGPSRLEPGEAVIPTLLNRLAVVARRASLDRLQSQALLDLALADATAMTILSAINARAARFSLPPFEMNELVALYGKYDLSTLLYEKFVFSASDIVRYRLADGCTSCARAFIALVKAMGIFALPTEMRYAATARAADYSAVCSVGADNGTGSISGHQVVLAKVDDRWQMVNTASNEAVRALPTDFDPADYLEPVAPFTNEPILFDCETPAITHLYRKIGGDWDDGICDNAFDNLMNIYSSGSYESPVCAWPDYP